MFATLTDVSTRLGRPIADEYEIAQVTAWIDDVEDMILARATDLEERVAAGAPTVTTVARVVAASVIRKIHNPEGKIAEGVDDYNYRRSETAGRGELFLTDEEWALLLPAARSGAFTIRPAWE